MMLEKLQLNYAEFNAIESNAHILTVEMKKENGAGRTDL